MIIDTLSAPRPAPPPVPIQVVKPVVRRSFRPVLTFTCWGYLCAVVAVWLAIRQGGDRWWVGTVLMIAPRWPFLVPLAGLWAWVIWARRWWQAGPTAAASWVVVFAMMGFRMPSLPGGPERGDIRILSCNVHRQQFHPEELMDFVSKVRPDIVALQGWSETNHQALFMSDGWNVRKEGELFLASRFPIGNVTPLNIVDDPNTPLGERGAAAIFEVQGPRGLIHLVNLHLASPHAGLLSATSDSGDKLTGNVARRWHESSLLLGMVESVQGAMVMTGDFNTTDDSPIFRECWGNLADAFTERGSGFGYTYLIGHTQLRIDHVLVGPSFEFTRSWVGPMIGSPHRPLMADIVCR